MVKIFYTDKCLYTTESALKKILTENYNIPNATILRTENGKPYIHNGPYFSVTHSKSRLYFIFSNHEVGLDAESIFRPISHEAIVKKFPKAEQQEITSTEIFLMHWVAKESAIKYMGTTLARDLQNLAYINGQLFFHNAPFIAKISFARHEEFLLAICGNDNFEKVTFIQL